MASLWQSNASGEYAIVGDNGRFAWGPSRNQIEALFAAENNGQTFFVEDGEPTNSDDEIFDSLSQVLEADWRRKENGGAP